MLYHMEFRGLVRGFEAGHSSRDPEIAALTSYSVSQEIDLNAKLLSANQEIEQLKTERDEEIETLKYQPGIFECAKCDLRLVAKVISVKSGSIGMNSNPQECSNGCGPMWKVTRAQYIKRLHESNDALFTKYDNLKTAAQGLVEAAEKLLSINEEYQTDKNSGPFDMVYRKWLEERPARENALIVAIKTYRKTIGEG